MKRLAFMIGAFALTGIAAAHDIWIEASAASIKMGEEIRLSLMLGNHGNTHRDFKLASQVAAADRRLLVIDPAGRQIEMTSLLKEDKNEAGDGFWTARVPVRSPGCFLVASSFDKVMSYAPVRDVKSAKTLFRVGALPLVGFDRILGHSLELVPLSDPFAREGEFRVRLLFKGKPLANTKVSFIPRGVTLSGEIDSRYERMTDADGVASLVLPPVDTLVAAHLKDEKAKGKGYESIGYSATLWLRGG